MIAIIFLLLFLFHGVVLTNFFSIKYPIIKIAFGFTVGSLFSVSSIYWIACLAKSLDTALILFLVVSLFVCIRFFRQYKEALQVFGAVDKKTVSVFVLLFAFSYWLFAKSFGYDSAHGNFLVASNVYLDFGAHIPFIRSFSMGNNFPGEVPFFGSSGLLYYFLFDFYTGIVEHLGLRIDVAYNALSSISFTFLLVMIYSLAYEVFKKKAVGILSVVFFLFSSNLSFLTFFQQYGFHLFTLSSWWHNNFYFEGQPTLLDKTIQVSGFLNLNPYINQRHLVFGILFLLFFLFIWMITLKEKESVHTARLWILGISFGLLPMWHTMIFIALLMLCCVMFLVYPTLRKKLFITVLIASILAFPQLFLIKLHSANTIVFKPGFLLENMITIKNELVFWLGNLGIALLTIPIGFVLASKEQRKFFLIFLPLFIIPNLIHLSSRFTFDDHKYFNVWIIGMGMFSALCISQLLTKNISAKILAIFCIIFLTLSGIISIMVIKNDVYAVLPDYPKNTLLTWVTTHIPINQVILTNGEIYDPVTLIGRKTFIGRVQYIYVYGGNASKRLTIQQSLLQPTSYVDTIRLAKENNLLYAVFYKGNFAKNEKQVNLNFYNKLFPKVYEDSQGVIYKI